MSTQAHGSWEDHQPAMDIGVSHEVKSIHSPHQRCAYRCGYTANRVRPRLRRVRITRRPVWDRMRTRNPDTRFLLRLVPPKVRLVISVVWRLAHLSRRFYQSVHVD